MKIAAIIAEYNPFHTGHEYQIKELRNLLGEDTAIIAIMSGNFTQRGEPSIFDKATRSKMAVLSGANLVLELPFPFSSATAAKRGLNFLICSSIISVLEFAVSARTSKPIS